MKHIFDASFRYTPAVKTDIKATFARERKRLAAEAAAQKAVEAEQQQKVQQLNRRK